MTFNSEHVSSENLEFWRFVAHRARHHTDHVIQKLPHRDRHVIVEHYRHRHHVAPTILERTQKRFGQRLRRHLRVTLLTLPDDLAHDEERHIITILLKLLVAGTFDEFLNAVDDLD